MRGRKMGDNLIEWEGQAIHIPKPFNEANELINYIVSFIGWSLQEGKNFSNRNELIREIKKDLDLREKELNHILDVLQITVPIKPESIGGVIDSDAIISMDYEHLLSRRSIRKFNENEVTHQEIMYLLNAARHAPSARNIQPIEYILVKNKEKKKKLAKISRQNQPETSSVSIIVVGDLNLANLVGKISPHDVTTSEKGVNMFIYMDAAAAIQNMILAAHKIKLGSLWISSFDEKSLKELIKLPEDHVPLGIICFGKYDDVPKKPPKRKINEILHLEDYKEKKHDLKHLNFSHLINLRY